MCKQESGRLDASPVCVGPVRLPVCVVEPARLDASSPVYVGPVRLPVCVVEPARLEASPVYVGPVRLPACVVEFARLEASPVYVEPVRLPICVVEPVRLDALSRIFDENAQCWLVTFQSVRMKHWSRCWYQVQMVWKCSCPNRPPSNRMDLERTIDSSLMFCRFGIVVDLAIGA